MRKILIISFLLLTSLVFGQKVTADIFRHKVKTTTEMNALSSPLEGDEIYNTTTKTIWTYNGTIWVETSGDASLGGGIVAEGNFTISSAGDNTVTHGLGYVPSLQRISIVKLNGVNTTSPSYFIDNITSTQMTINVTNISADVTIGWAIFGTGSETPLDGGEVATLLDTEIGDSDWRTDDQTAAEVPITDAGGHTSETDVEGATQELYATKINNDIAARTNTESIEAVAAQAQADFDTDGDPATGEFVLIKDPDGMTGLTPGTTVIDFVDADGYLKDSHLFLDNTTDDETAFTLVDMGIGHVFHLYMNQATEPGFTPTVTIKEDTLDWTTDSLASIPVTLTIWKNGMGTYEGVYTKGH